MSENPTTGTGAGTTRVVYTGDEPNPILHFLQRPRIMLLLLAGWSLIGVLAQAFTRTDFLVNNGHNKIHGLFGGLAFGWEGIPLAAVYIYCFRDPLHHRAVFWLALLHMGALIASQLFHLGTGDYGFLAIIAPLAGSIGIACLVFPHLLHQRTHEEIAARNPS